MTTTKLYLYKLLSDVVGQPLHKTSEKGVIFTDNNWPLVGLDRHNWRGNKMGAVENKLQLKEFEVEQKNFDALILNSDRFGAKLTYIGFSNELSLEEQEELLYLLTKGNAEELLDFVDTQRYEYENDIYEICFRMSSGQNDNVSFTFTRDAVLTVSFSSSNEIPISSLVSIVPVGVLAGTINPYVEEAYS